MPNNTNFRQLRADRYARLGTELLKASAHYLVLSRKTADPSLRAEADLLEKAAFAMRAAARHPTRGPDLTQRGFPVFPDGCPEWVKDGLIYLDTKGTPS